MGTEVNAAQETPNAAQTDTTNTTQAQSDQTQTPKSESAPAQPQAAEKKAEEVEVKYDLKLDEASVLDKSEVGEIEAYAKANKLNNEQAQHLLNMKHEAVSKFQQKQLEEFNVAKERWRQEVVEDKEIGGDKFNKSVELAHRALERFGSTTLKEQLEATGLGNHPELVRFFAKVGHSMAEGEIIKANATPVAQKSYEEIFYGGKN